MCLIQDFRYFIQDKGAKKSENQKKKGGSIMKGKMISGVGSS